MFTLLAIFIIEEGKKEIEIPPSLPEELMHLGKPGIKSVAAKQVVSIWHSTLIIVLLISFPAGLSVYLYQAAYKPTYLLTLPPGSTS